MGKSRVQEYLENYKTAAVRFNPYAIKKTGLLQSQTMLKLEDYMLICAPYQLSMEQVILLVILSRDEITFFQQFQSKLASLTIAFHRPGTKSPLNLFVRGTLARIGPVKGRENVCMADVVYRNCPNDLTEIIGDYLMAYESLKGQYENFKGREVAVDAEAARIMRYNNYSEVQLGGEKVQVQLAALSVDHVTLRLPQGLSVPQRGQPLSAKLYFQLYQFLVNGKVSAVEKTDAGRSLVKMEISFTPELVEILDDYYYRLTFEKS